VATLAFDSLRYARRLREAGVPEPQAEAQAELMAEAFGFYVDNIVTRDYLDAVLGAGFGKHDQRFDHVDNRFEQIDERFRQIDDRFEQIDERFRQVDNRFEQIEGRLERLEHRLEKLEPLRIQATLHSFMLGLIVLVQVVPQLQTWFAP
jgi:hypothetical protein